MAQEAQREEDWSRYWMLTGERAPLVTRLLQTRLGRSMSAYYGEKTAAQKAFLAWDLGGPYWATLLRIRESPEFIAKMPKEIRVVSLPGGRRGVHPLDIPKFTKWMGPALLREAEKNPQLGEQLRAKEPAFIRFVKDCATDPRVFLGVPELKLVGVAGKPLVGAIGRTALYRRVAARYGPKLAGVFLSAKTRIAGLGDAELSELVAKLQERLGIEAQAGAWARGEVGRVVRPAGAVTRRLGPLRVLLRRYSNTEISEAVLLLDKAEDMAEYSRLVKAGDLPRASSNRVLALFSKLRKEITRPAFKRMEPAAPVAAGAAAWRPVRGAMPGAEETAARARVKRLGGIEAARKVPLKQGEYRMLEELKPLRTRKGKLFRWEDPATGQRVTPYRRRYMARAKEARPAEETAKLPEEVGAPGMRRPRQLEAAPVARSLPEVERALRAIVRGEARYRVLYGQPETRALMARAMSRAEGLKDPEKMATALGILDDMMKQHERSTVNAALSFLDTWGVVRVKQVYTLYNPAWYLKNYIDTVWVKNLLAGVPASKLHRYSRELPLDVFGRPVEWGGVNWTQELTGLNPGRLTSHFMRLGNKIENTGRRAVGDLAYWREIEARGGGEALKKAGSAALKGAHEAASLRARRAVAQVHFDYSALGKVDEVLRRIFPFWMYQKNQLRWMAEQAVARPRVVYGGYKFFDLGEKGGGPAVGLPGLPTLKVQGLAGLSPVRFMKTISGTLADDERERERWQKAGPLGRWVQRGEKWGFYIHPLVEQGLSRILKGTDLMDDRSWKQVAPMVGAVGKMMKVDMTYLGVWRTMFPEDQYQPREGELKRAFKQRVMQRQAFAILDGKPMTVAQANKYVGREFEVAGVLAVFGLYPQVREPRYDEMQRLLKERQGLSYADRQVFDQRHEEIGLFLAARSMKAR